MSLPVPPNKYGAFRQEQRFTDIRLSFGDRSYACHRIFLAKHSGFFRDLFRGAPTCTRFTLPKDPDGAFEEVLLFIYGAETHTSRANIVQVLKCADFYDMESLQNHLEFLMHQLLEGSLKSETALHLIGTFLRFQMERRAESLLPIICPCFLDEIGITQRAVCATLTPKLFAELLRTLSDKLTNTQKFEYITTAYVPHHPGLSGDDRAALGSAIEWTSIEFLLRRNCDWVPDAVSRRGYGKILDNRRMAIHWLEKETAHITNDVSRLYLMNCANQIWRSEERPKSERYVVNLFESMSTFGGLLPLGSLDPFQFGWFATSSTPRGFDRYFDAKFAFVGADQYFMAIGDSKHPPTIRVDLGRIALFYVQQVAITYPPRKFNSAAILLEGETEDGSVVKIAELAIGEAGADKMALVVKANQPFGRFRFSLKGSTGNGGWIMRVGRIELRGFFVAYRK
jgi:hypothetical protein